MITKTFKMELPYLVTSIEKCMVSLPMSTVKCEEMGYHTKVPAMWHFNVPKQSLLQVGNKTIQRYYLSALSCYSSAILNRDYEDYLLDAQ